MSDDKSTIQMTPQQWAECARNVIDAERKCRERDGQERELQLVANLVHQAVRAEIETCALACEAAALRWPENPQVAAVLRSMAAELRERGEA